MSTTTAKARAVRLYVDVLGLPLPDLHGDDGPGQGSVTIPVPPADLPLLRWRLLAAGAPVQDESPTSVSFRDPAGVRVELVAESPAARDAS
jgi:catechol 2,3-dioxygenase-like lactoylglutathione lyase family enzyme